MTPDSALGTRHSALGTRHSALGNDNAIASRLQSGREALSIPGDGLSARPMIYREALFNPRIPRGAGWPAIFNRDK